METNIHIIDQHAFSVQVASKMILKVTSEKHLSASLHLPVQ